MLPRLGVYDPGIGVYAPKIGSKVENDIRLTSSSVFIAYCIPIRTLCGLTDRDTLCLFREY